MLINKILDFGIMLFLMHKNLKVYAVIGGETEGNVLLRKRQYEFPKENQLALSRHIVTNKIQNQRALLKEIRKKSIELKEGISGIKKLQDSSAICTDQQELLGIEAMLRTYSLSIISGKSNGIDDYRA